MSTQSNNEEEKELSIDFKALYDLAISFKWILLLVSLFFGLIAAIYVFNKPNEYTSSTSVMPELETSGIGGGLSKYAGLASLAGINLSDMAGSDAIRPDLYPNVINNTTFFLYLLEQKVKLSNGEEIKFEDFYFNAYKIDLEEDLGTAKSGSEKEGSVIDNIRNVLGIGLPAINSNLRKNGAYVFLSKTKGEVIEDLMEKVAANMDKKTGIISVSAEFPDPMVSAQVAKISMDYLTEFVTNYRTEKAKHDLNFLAERLGEAKGKYYNTQAKKAQYSDQFSAPTIRLQSADIQRERIESDYRVTSSFYQELLQQYETAKLKVQQETPVFKTLQQPVVPFKKSGPKRVIVVLFSLFFGLFFALFLVLLKNERYKKVLKYN
ncbi:Polysaccharide chain length determinant N-terminal domain containing protein [Spirosomataceae bacterium]